jgi:hypothetical protein
MAALTSSALRLGKSPRMSSGASPAARLANTVRSVTRVPLKTGSPPQLAGSRRIRSSYLPPLVAFSIWFSEKTFLAVKDLKIIGRPKQTIFELWCKAGTRNAAVEYWIPGETVI